MIFGIKLTGDDGIHQKTIPTNQTVQTCGGVVFIIPSVLYTWYTIAIVGWFLTVDFTLWKMWKSRYPHFLLCASLTSMELKQMLFSDPQNCPPGPVFGKISDLHFQAKSSHIAKHLSRIKGGKFLVNSSGQSKITLMLPWIVGRKTSPNVLISSPTTGWISTGLEPWCHSNQRLGVWWCVEAGTWWRFGWNATLPSHVFGWLPCFDWGETNKTVI
jgi:hypothetical protein